MASLRTLDLILALNSQGIRVSKVSYDYGGICLQLRQPFQGNLGRILSYWLGTVIGCEPVDPTVGDLPEEFYRLTYDSSQYIVSVLPNGLMDVKRHRPCMLT